MRPPKTDFRFLFYTQKNMYLKKEKYLFWGMHIYQNGMHICFLNVI